MISTIKMNMPVFVVIIPLFIAFVLPTFGNRLKLVEGLVISTVILWLLGVGYLASMVLLKDGIPSIYSLGGWIAPWGIELKIDSLAAFFYLL